MSKPTKETVENVVSLIRQVQYWTLFQRQRPAISLSLALVAAAEQLLHEMGRPIPEEETLSDIGNISA